MQTLQPENLWMGGFTLTLLANGALLSSSELPPLLPLVLPFFWPCFFLVAVVAVVCWRLVLVPNMKRRFVLQYGIMIIVCAAELHFCVEYMLKGSLQLFLSVSPTEPLLLVVQFALSLFSGVVQFGIAALGAGICSSAILAGHSFPS